MVTKESHDKQISSTFHSDVFSILVPKCTHFMKSPSSFAMTAGDAVITFPKPLRTTAATTMPREYLLNFVGDVMLGRLIDQLFPLHVDEPSEARIISRYRSTFPDLGAYSAKSPWGNVLPFFHTADLNIINLETAATTHAKRWPNKVFNYRTHPANIEALKVARVDYASLANNHTLDFCVEGLVETVRTLKLAEIKFAGAGESRDEATRPAILTLPRRRQQQQQQQQPRSSESSGNSNVEDAQRAEEPARHTLHIYSASDHPSDWSKVQSFHLIDYSTSTRARLKTLLTSSSSSSSTAQQQQQQQQPSLKIFSVHWGPNYSWHPSPSIRSLAHYLIDDCGVDIIHGHSSHHVQGVERYRGKLIIYGCGDFVDDYAVTPGFRNDLSAVWRVIVVDSDDEKGTTAEGKSPGLRLKRLEIFPSRIKRFQVEMLEREDPDHGFVSEKIVDLSREFGTDVRRWDAGHGQLVIDL